MTFIDDNGNVIEAPGRVSMTKQSISLLNFKISGDVSLNFNIPNTSTNRKTLNYDGPQMLNQVAWTRQPFSRLDKSGNILDRGYIAIQNEDGDLLNCFYASGNGNWIASINGLITDLDWSGYVEAFILSTINGKVSATEGIVYPFVNWTQRLERGINYLHHEVFHPADGFGSTGMVTVVDSSGDYSKGIFDFYPCLYLKTLMQEIAQQNGIKIAGTVLNDKKYQTMVITPSSGEMVRDVFNSVILSGSSQAIAGTSIQKYTSFIEILDPENRFASNTYTAAKAGVVFYVTVAAATVNTFDIVLYKNGVEIDRFETSAAPFPQEWAFKIVRAEFGDTFEIYIDNEDGSSQNITLNVKIETPQVIRPGDWISPANFIPKYSCIDMIKFVVNFFGCEVYFDAYSKTLSLNIIEKMKPEDAENWSDFYLKHRNEYTVAQAMENYMRVSDPSEDSLKNFNAINKRGYGEGLIETNIELKKTLDLFTIPFGASEHDKNPFGVYATNVPLVDLEDGEAIPFSGYSTAFGLTLFTFISATQKVLNFEIVRIVNSVGINLGYFIVNNGGTGTCDMKFIHTSGTDSGTIYRQNAKPASIKPRILVNDPNRSWSDFSNNIDSSSGYNVVDESGTTAKTTIAYAFYCKRKTGLNIDGLPTNLAFNNPSDSFIDPSVADTNFGRITRILNSPTMRFQLQLPMSDYQKFDFSKFVYFKTKKFTGFVLIESIVNYQDTGIPVEVNAYMYG